MDLHRARRRLAAALGLARYPAGYEPPPGAGARRFLFGIVWLVVGVALTRAFLIAQDAIYVVLAVFWFGLGAVDLGRGARLLQAERHRHDDPG